jgi:hypothetical protein
MVAYPLIFNLKTITMKFSLNFLLFGIMFILLFVLLPTKYGIKFNSSDLYKDLQIDSTYSVRVVGKRIPFLSMYRNIIEIKK